MGGYLLKIGISKPIEKSNPKSASVHRMRLC
jgi:hypothetical protein